MDLRVFRYLLALEALPAGLGSYLYLGAGKETDERLDGPDQYRYRGRLAGGE